ncbi:MAG TPA: cation transporter, partial [Micromonosporaceae bacterium]
TAPRHNVIGVGTTPAPRPANRRHLRLRVTGMACRRCVRQVTAWMRDVPGVETVEADPSTGIVDLVGSMNPAQVLAAFTGSDFTAQVLDTDPTTGKSTQETHQPSNEERQQ